MIQPGNDSTSELFARVNQAGKSFLFFMKNGIDEDIEKFGFLVDLDMEIYKDFKNIGFEHEARKTLEYTKIHCQRFIEALLRKILRDHC